MELDFTTIQAIAMVALPIVVQLLKAAIPNLEGQVGFWANLALNILSGLMAAWGTGDATVVTGGLSGIITGMAGSKGMDVARKGVNPISYARPASR